MRRRESFSVAEISLLLNIKSQITGKVLDKLMLEAMSLYFLDAVNQNLRNPDTVQNSDNDRKKFQKKVNLIIAKNLKRNDPGVPLLAKQDLELIANYIIAPIAPETEKLSPKEKEIFEKVARRYFESLISLAAGTRGIKGKRAYEDYWRCIEAVLLVARENKVKLTELPQVSGVRKQLLKLVYKNKRKFRSDIIKVVDRLTNAEKIMRTMLVPILEAVVSVEGLSEGDDLDSVKADFRKDFMPELIEKTNQIRNRLYTIVDAEVEQAWS